MESLPPISVPVFKAKSISTVTTKAPVAAEPKPEPIIPPPPILPKVSVAPKKVSEKVSDALPPFDLAVQALKSAGVSEALYAVNEKKKVLYARCIVKVNGLSLIMRTGKWQIQRFTLMKWKL